MSTGNSIQFFICVLCFTFFGAFQGASAQCGPLTPATRPLPSDLTQVDLEKLLSFDLEVTSASKKTQKYSEVTSAVTVLTQEDFRRSGATHVGDVLRMVPGLQVAQIDAHRWAITSRGFNSAFANKLLVLIDGQSIFHPGFNGVFWDQYDIDLQDVYQIEVIRGPGAAIWGSNAVNGVINIITCNAAHTEGGYVSGAGGTENRVIGAARYGGKIGDDTYYRIYGRYKDHDENKFVGGKKSEDEFDIARGGFRIDSFTSEKDMVTFKAEGFYGGRDLQTVVPTLVPPFTGTDEFSGEKDQYGTNILAKWVREFSEDSELTLQGDYIFEKQKGKVFPFRRQTMHFDAQYRFSPLEKHDVMVGAGYRWYSDDITPVFADEFIPKDRSTDLFTWFLNDEVTLIEETLRFIAGAKFEKNAHTGLEFMPNGRLLWTPHQNHSFWFAVSHAVANPSRIQDDVFVPVAAFPEPMSGLTGVVSVIGNRNVEAETLTAYEFGYRTDAIENVSFDFTAFYNNYDDIVSAEPGMPFVGSVRGTPVPVVIIPQFFSNELEAYSYGAEVSIEWQPVRYWRAIGSYSYLNLNLVQGNSLDVANIDFFEGAAPENQAHLRSFLDLPYNLEFDTILRYVDHLSSGNVPGYLELDLRIGWRPSEDFEVSVVGQNLLDNYHQEFEGRILPPLPVEIQRGVYGKFTWFF